MSRNSTFAGLVAGAVVGVALGVSLVRSAGAQQASDTQSNTSQTSSSQTSDKGGVVTTTASGQARAGGATSVSGFKVGTAGGSASGSADGQGGGSARDSGKKLFLVEYSRGQGPQRNVQGQALAHDMHVAQAARSGQVLLAGPLEDGLEAVLLQAGDRSGAEAWLRTDPGLQDGSVRVVRFREWSVTHDNLGGRRVVTVPGPGKPPRGGG